MGNACNEENKSQVIQPQRIIVVSNQSNMNKNVPLIPESCSDKLYNCIVKIEINEMVSTGFFMKIKKYNEMNFLITCFHSIPDNYFEKKETINICYGKKGKEKNIEIKLDDEIRYIKRDQDKDIILIEILKNDNVPNSKYLYPDLNYKNGYNLYINKYFYLAGYPSTNNNERCFSAGQIKTIKINEFKFLHSLDTEAGSSGSPICLKDGLFVIGIHRASSNVNKLKEGVFLGKVIDELEIKGIEEKELDNNKEKDWEPTGMIHIFNLGNFRKTLFSNLNNRNYILNEMTIVYNNKNLEKNIRIFGDIFVNNNYNNIKIIVNDKEQKINPIIYTEYKREIIVKLLEIKPITDLSFLFFECSQLQFLYDISNWSMINVENMSGMFANCTSITSLPDISNWDTSNVYDMRGMFYGCISLKVLPDISKWNISKISSLKNMFRKCSSLKSLPDISKWIISNIKDLGGLFADCSSIKALPDISKWDTSNVTDMSEIFKNCSSLSSLPDISKWDTSKVVDFRFLFQNCNSLLSLPDISKWDTTNIVCMDGIFEKCVSLTFLPDISKWETSNIETLFWIFAKCCSLESIPDISKWDVSNVKSIKGIFAECLSLKNLPDISYWDTSIVKEMIGIFYDCPSLLSIPDISKWDTSNVYNMCGLFSKCSSLLSIPDISKWNTSNVRDMTELFSKCSSLKSLPDISKWDITNLENLSFMFSNCSSLGDLKVISNWKLKEGAKLKGIFEGLDEQIVSIEILNTINKSLHPDAVNYQIYPELLRYLFNSSESFLWSVSK